MDKVPGGIRGVDELGRMVIPREVRRAAGWEAGQQLQVWYDPKTRTAMVRPYQYTCIFCGIATDEAYQGVPLCVGCAVKAAEKMTGRKWPKAKEAA